MNWLYVYLTVVTVAAIWCAFGWWYSHSILKELAHLGEGEWPLVRSVLMRLLR